MADQKVRVLVERRPGNRVRLRFLSRAPNAASPGDTEHELGGGGDARVIVGSDLLGQEALLASISLGQMQAYTALCARNGLSIEIYRDDALCTLSDAGSESSRVRVVLRPRLVFRGHDTPAARAAAIRLINEALGQSVFFGAPRIAIELEPVFEFQSPE